MMIISPRQVIQTKTMNQKFPLIRFYIIETQILLP